MAFLTCVGVVVEAAHYFPAPEPTEVVELKAMTLDLAGRFVCEAQDEEEAQEIATEIAFDESVGQKFVESEICNRDSIGIVSGLVVTDLPSGARVVSAKGVDEEHPDKNIYIAVPSSSR